MTPAHHHDPAADFATEAVLEGDILERRVKGKRGTAGAALRHRDYRIVWGGTFASNIGTWMQNVLLGAFGYELTHSASYVGILYFAQLGPLLVLAPVGGVLADMLDRRKVLIWMQLEQLVFSVVLAFLAAAPQPNRTLIVLCVLVIGIGNALSGPALGALLPTIVPREDLPGAVSLQSVQMNLSRVIGPAIGAPLYTAMGAGSVFGLNAGTYVFAIAGLVIARYERRSNHEIEESGFARFASGFRIAAADPLIRRVLVTLVAFSFFSLTFVGLMPAIAAKNLGIATKSIEYGMLYAVFGLGAALGAMSVGTVLTDHSKERLVRIGLVAFAVLLTLFASLRVPGAAFPTVFVLGYAYFVVITSLSTVLQEHLDDAVRGRVMSLWLLGFGGMVPLGVLLGGYVVGLMTLTGLMLAGAAVAALLAWYADLAEARVSAEQLATT